MRFRGKIRRLPLTTLLWVSLLLAAQTLAVAHEHVDEAPGTPCVVCTLAKAQTAACGSPAHAESQPPDRPAPEADDTSLRLNAPHTPFHPRAPPQA